MMSNRKFDFLVIGSGGAGLTFALHAADHGSVAIITKNDVQEANTSYAQGGIASVWDESDTFDQHVADTLDAGDGLCDPDIVRMIVKEGPEAIQSLLDLGARFTQRDGELHLGREGGHSQERIIHAADATGQEVERVLVEAVRRHPNIEILEHTMALELLTQHHLGHRVTRYDDLECYGAYVLDTQSDAVHTILSKITVLASGGAASVYQHTTNPPVATGDGIAMAYRAKARIANMEFMQFHPTALYHPQADSFLISEALRGHGAKLVNKRGQRFMRNYDQREELAPRDIVARAIDDQLKKWGDECVYLDITHQDAIETRELFPSIYETCKSFDIDITQELIPVVPAAHYTCGGVITDENGCSSILNLVACGEVAYTGLHGANRLASNSLLESLVMAKRAAQQSSQRLDEIDFNDHLPDWDASGTTNNEEWILVSHNLKELRQIMGDYVGIVRSDLRLQRAQRRIRLLFEEVEDFYERTHITSGLAELRNMIAVAELIIRSALMRKESRGLHYTTDYPNTDPQLAKPTII
ncbi:MAG: L-aspartate oxidase [Bacteroidota bacterium]